MDKKSLQEYINVTNKYLESNDQRLLTDEEQNTVIEHLLEVANNYDPSTSKARDLAALLCLEATIKVCEIHPGMENPTEEQIKFGKARSSKEFDAWLSVM